jgi:hypothetical protein
MCTLNCSRSKNIMIYSNPWNVAHSVATHDVLEIGGRNPLNFIKCYRSKW